MKKSPFSTPRGNGARRGFGRHSAGSPGQGYAHPRIHNLSSPLSAQSPQSPSGSEDFIPFNSTPQPTSHRKSNNQWRSPRGQWSAPRHVPEGASPVNNTPRRHSFSPTYANKRNNHQYTPYHKDTRRKQFNGARRMLPCRNGKIDISGYLDMRSFLENPWAELEAAAKSKCAKEPQSSSSSSFISDNTAATETSTMDSTSSPMQAEDTTKQALEATQL